MLHVAVGLLAVPGRETYLMQTRPAGKDFAGCWEFPGGRREEGESPRETLEREYLEETDLRVCLLNKNPVLSAYFGTNLVGIQCVISTYPLVANPAYPDQVMRACEGQPELVWMRLADVGALRLTPFSRLLVTYLQLKREA